MTKAELVKLEIEKIAFKETWLTYIKCNGDIMDCNLRVFLNSLINKSDKIQQIIDENYDSATD